MKKILICSLNLKIGGIEKLLVDLINQIPKEEYDITLMLLQKEGVLLKYIPKHIKVITPPFKTDMNASLGLKYLIKQKIRQKNFFTALILFIGLIFNYLLNWNFVIKKCCFKKQNIKYDYIFNFWGINTLIHIIATELYKSDKYYIWIHDEKILFKKYGKYYSKYNFIFCVSKELTKKLRKIYKNISDKIMLLCNRIDTKNILKLSNDIGFEGDYNGFKILSVGRLSYIKKGFDIAIKACKILTDKGYDFKWYIIGEGKKQNGAEREYVTNLIKENKLENRFVLLGEKENPYPFFKECDIYVQSSRAEGYCLTLAEAKLFNKPIVTTAFVGSYEQIKNNKTGIVVDTTPEGVAAGVQKLLDNKELREKLINNLKEENKLPKQDYFAELKKFL